MLDDATAGNLVLTGYVVTRPVQRAPWMDAALVPERLLTSSSCIAPFLPDTWALEWVSETRAGRLDHLRRFELYDHALDDALDEVVAWTTARFDDGVGWPNILTTLASAHELLALLGRFAPATHDARLLALCLARDDVDAFLARCAVPPGEGAPAMLALAAARASPPKNATVLGSDVLGFEQGGSFHSFLCHGLEKDFARELAATPNTVGLYDDHEVARRCAAWTTAEGRGEPVPWFAWRVLDVPRQADGVAPGGRCEVLKF